MFGLIHYFDYIHVYDKKFYMQNFQN